MDSQPRRTEPREPSTPTPLNASTGAITGTPTTVAGPLNLTVKAADSHAQAADAVLGLTVSQTLTPATVYTYTVPTSGGYAPNGNLLSYTDTVMGTWTFSYDHLNRISSAIPGAGAPSGYSGSKLCMAYDSFGDRTQSNFQTTACSSSNPATANYSAANQVTWTTVNSASSGFGYDASGNVLFDGVNYYAYDSEGQVCAVQNSPVSGGTVAYGYLYDADGRRVAKGTITVTSTPLAPSVCNPATNGFTLTESYVLGQAGEELTTLNVDGSWQRTNVYGEGKLIATYDEAGLHFHLTDPLGTRRMQTTAAGVPELDCQSLPFGDQQSCSPTAFAPADDSTPLHFTGKERDTESGNDYFGARYYGSSMGRFLSPDPLLDSGLPDDPQTWNRYTYALNNPLRVVDPTGLYNLENTCGSLDKDCNADFKANAESLKNQLAALNNALNDPSTAKSLGLAAVVRLSQGLAALGTENDGNNVNIRFGATGDGSAAQTNPIYNAGSNSYSYNITFDPTKNSGPMNYGINGDHEGIHAYDYSNYMMSEKTTESPFQQEYRGYQNSAWAAQGLGLPNISFRNTQIWNKSWAAADRQTLMDKGITKVVTDKDHPETQPHNPNSP
jgi:RHS repeat-associated protein